LPSSHRLERLRQIIDKGLRQQPDLEEGRCGFVHLYGVAALCALLAIKRGLDQELCTTAGMLHDIWQHKYYPVEDHAHLSAKEAEEILVSCGGYAQEEIAIICDAIRNHCSTPIRDK